MLYEVITILGRFSYPIPIIGSVCYHPHNVVTRAEQPLFFLIGNAQFEVGKKVRNLLKSTHSQRYKPVAMFPSAQRKWPGERNNFV